MMRWAAGPKQHMYRRRIVWVTLAGTITVGVAIAALCWYHSEERAIRAIAALGGEATRYHGGDVTWVHLSDAKDADAAIALVHAFRNLDHLDLSNSNVTDAGLAKLNGNPSLTYLQLSNTAITDVGLSSLTRLPHLLRLDLDGTKVTDTGIGNLQYFDCLRVVILDHTAITDGALEHLHIPCLGHLSVKDTKITEAAARAYEQRVRSTILVQTDVFP